LKDYDTRLYKREEILKALKIGEPVYADVPELPERLPVREVKISGGLLRVRLLEGWRVPMQVYISTRK